MRELIPYILMLFTSIMFVLNGFALMQILPIYVTGPLFFISIYLTIFTFNRRYIYRRMR